MEYFIKLIKKKYKVDVSKDARALQKLRREAERAKRALSSQHQVGCRVRRGLMLLLLWWVIDLCSVAAALQGRTHTEAAVQPAFETVGAWAPSVQ
jgi:hypothetical protein